MATRERHMTLGSFDGIIRYLNMINKQQPSRPVNTCSKGWEQHSISQLSKLFRFCLGLPNNGPYRRCRTTACTKQKNGAPPPKTQNLRHQTNPSFLSLLPTFSTINTFPSSTINTPQFRLILNSFYSIINITNTPYL